MISFFFVYYHLFICLLLCLLQSSGYIFNKVVYDKLIFISRPRRHKIEFPIAYFDYQNCSLTSALSKTAM